MKKLFETKKNCPVSFESNLIRSFLMTSSLMMKKKKTTTISTMTMINIQLLERLGYSLWSLYIIFLKVNTAGGISVVLAINFSGDHVFCFLWYFYFFFFLISRRFFCSIHDDNATTSKMNMIGKFFLDLSWYYIFSYKYKKKSIENKKIV